MRKKKIVWSGLMLLIACRLMAASSWETLPDAGALSEPQAWRNPKIRPWKDYPFFEKPERKYRTALWRNYDDVPVWGQRGHILYAFLDDCGDTNIARLRASVQDVKDSGVTCVHIDPIKWLSPEMVRVLKEADLPFVVRLDGQFFWGDKHNELMSTIRYSGWDWYHNTVPNNDWYRKFPPSLAATRVLRDGQPIIEYYGSMWVQRRDLNYMHPVSIQMRDAFLRECLLGEQVFDRPVGLACTGHVSGVWWDNPGNTAVSYDPYSVKYIASEFKKKFGGKCRAFFEKEYVERLAKMRDETRKIWETAEKKEEAWRRDYETWFCDPPTLWMRMKDREIQRWWEDVWADAYAGYYAWQYKFMQEEIAPKLGKKHMFVGGNGKLCWSASSWDYYLFSWPTYDLFGPNQTTLIYTDKEAAGFKLALAASDGKPAGVFEKNTDVERCQAIACLGVEKNLPKVLCAFQTVNMDLYHNAMPGGRVAILYHLEDGIHHNEIANLCRVCDQVWRTGVPLEVMTELHLTPEVLKQFDGVIVPGFQFSNDEVGRLKAYVEGGGKLILIGDNRDEAGIPLAAVLAGMAPPWKAGVVEVGKGKVTHFDAQLVTQAQMSEALAKNGGTVWQIVQPAGANLLPNVLVSADKKTVSVHIVNYTGKPIKDVKLKVPAGLERRPGVFVSPYGGQRELADVGGELTIPLLDIYGVVVLCPDADARKAVLSRNTKPEIKPTGEVLPVVKMNGDIPEREAKLESLKSGQKLCYLRQYSKAGFRRIDADVILDGEGRKGQAMNGELRIHAVGLWCPEKVFIDKFALVMVDEASGGREEVAVPMEQVKGGSGGEAVREIKDFAAPAGTFVQRMSSFQWIPKKAGRYQAYLSYRYVDEVYEGKPDVREDKRFPDLSDYFFSRPLRKIVYEDRLPGLVVNVGE